MPGVPEDRSVTVHIQNSKDPRTKNPGVFCFLKRIMIETDTKTKKQKQAEFMQQHTLTKEDTEKLIREKLERARAYSEAWRKREALLVESR